MAHFHDPLRPHSHDPNPAPPSESPDFILSLPDGSSQAITPDDLRRLPQTTVPDCRIVSTGHGTSGPFAFTGVTLAAFVAHYWPDAWEQVEVISGDGFGTRLSAAEVNVATDRPILLACTIDGHPLSRAAGLVRLIVPSETGDALRQVKWVGEMRILAEKLHRGDAENTEEMQEKTPRSPRRRGEILIGIDVGGTFTDFVLLADGHLRVHKFPTTPDDQSRGIVAGLAELLPPSPLEEGRAEVGFLGGGLIVHGTTAATNALLERKGARTALLTTAGFADVIEIGRQNRPRLYALHQQRPPQLVPAARRFEALERLDVDGAILTPLDEEALDALAQQMAAAQPESVAIVFLFSYRNPVHEERAAEILRRHLPHALFSLSSRVLPEYREYERTATTVVNAYVQPLADRYLRRLSAALGDAPVRVMQSNGGAIGIEQASVEPARLVLSGPAGGVVGAFAAAAQALESDTPAVITFDMGGTSTDVALCPGEIPRTSESEIAGLPLRLPVIDIHTVGAGGGSLAYVDAGGGMRVGPQSAGAVPGPVCYGQGGTQATVTDANLVLGRLDGGHFLGGAGAVGLDEAAALAALTRLGQELGDFSPHAAALGVIRIANASMERALRRVSVERGHDPRTFTLIPFGGAGPLHACDLATALGVQRILIPPRPGVLSALGLLMADVVHENAQAILRDAAALDADVDFLRAHFERLVDQSRTVLAGEGVADPRLDAALDMRYRGQSYELTVPLATPIDREGLAAAVAGFHALHEQRYGYAMPDAIVEVVTLRLRGSGPGARPAMSHRALGPVDASPARLGERPVWFQAGGPTPTTAYDRARLTPGNRFTGPAIVHQFDTTTVIPPGWDVRVDGWGNLSLKKINH